MQQNIKSLVDDGILEFSLGNDDVALEIFQKALEDDPCYLPALRAISEVCLCLNMITEAENFCNRALAVDKKDLTSMVSLARILVKKGDKEGAEKASGEARILGWKEELSEN